MLLHVRCGIFPHAYGSQVELFSRNLITQVTRLDVGSKRQDPYHDEGDGGACYRAVLEQGTTPQVVLPRHGILHGGLVALPARA